jgi:hypothetical protein
MAGFHDRRMFAIHIGTGAGSVDAMPSQLWLQLSQFRFASVEMMRIGASGLGQRNLRMDSLSAAAVL